MSNTAEDPRLTYAFGHMVASFNPEDPHHADSGELGDDTLTEIGLDADAAALVWKIAEHVSGNYTYTGDAEETRRKIERGEL